MTNTTCRKIISWLIILSMSLTQIAPAGAQSMGVSLPAPGTMIAPSAGFAPAILRGLSIHPDNPLRFDFIIDTGDDNLSGDAFRDESARLVKYFLASLTVPENELWVNLSPYEQDRVMPDALSVTELGRDLLAQDYILKQLAASMIYPEDELGESFWNRVYQRAYDEFETTDIPLNAVHKIWIVPDRAVVYQHGSGAFVAERHLKVMLEEDYFALKNFKGEASAEKGPDDVNSMWSDIAREVLIPEIEHEVNHGEHFSRLRQIFNAMILATWYKKNLKESLLGRVYVDRNKVKGVDLEDRTLREKIYNTYLDAFKRGVYNYIKEDYDPASQRVTTRKYFSGGVDPGVVRVDTLEVMDMAMLPSARQIEVISPESNNGENRRVVVDLLENADPALLPAGDAAMLNGEFEYDDFLPASNWNDRKLIWSQDPEAVNNSLFSLAQSRGQKFLRLNLRNSNDIERLKTEVIVENGVITRVDGELLEILKTGGILLIDYTDADPKLVEAMNSLFDRRPYFDGVGSVNRDLTIVGVLSDNQAADYPTSFFSRFKGQATADEVYDDPFNQINVLTTDVPFSGETLDLFDMNDAVQVRDQLIGGYYIDLEGNIRVRKGALLRALEDGKSLLIRGGVWEDSVSSSGEKQPAHLTAIIRQILTEGSFRFNGRTYTLPEGFQVYRQSVDYSRNIRSKRIMADGESTGSDMLWIINSQTQDNLFNFVKVDPETGELLQQPGLLSRTQVRLKITENLPDWVWHRIMHAYSRLTIEVAPGVTVPGMYGTLRSEALKKQAVSPNIQTLEEVRDAKSMLIEGEDPDLILEEVKSVFGADNLTVLPVTPETTLQDLTEVINVYTSGDRRSFNTVPQALLTAMEDGYTVVLEGLHRNPELAREIESALTADPYLIANGVEIEDGEYAPLRLGDTAGRLIITTRSNDIGLMPEHHVRVESSLEQKREIIAREFPNDFTAQSFEAIESLAESFGKISLPEKPGLYPAEFDLSLSKLRMLYRYFRATGSWLTAFERVFIESYTEAPEMTAYMRVLTRLEFNVDYPTQNARSIHGAKLTTLLKKHVDPDELIWQMADTFSLDILKTLFIGTDTSDMVREKVLAIVHKALIKHHDDEREEFYREMYGLKEADVSDAFDIDQSAEFEGGTWQEQKEHVLQALRLTGGVFLQGSPGVGKSYITEQVARELGFANGEIYGPITTGSDTSMDDIVSERRLIDGSTRFIQHEIARWATGERGVLIVDESNLPKEFFWSFFKTFFSDQPHIHIGGVRHELNDHYIIFTGNQNYLPNRHEQEIVKNHMPTVHFHPFSPEFIRGLLANYVATDKRNRGALIDAMTELHFFFERMNAESVFSLRDLQELVSRVNVFTGVDWSMEQLIGQAWEIYGGNFTAEERMAFEYLLMDKYDFLVSEYSAKGIAKIREKYALNFSLDQIALVDSAAEMIISIEDFLEIRQARLDVRTAVQGKRGMIFEGPSGRGKDLILSKTLELNGFTEARNASAETPEQKIYHHINASLDVDAIVSRIRDAQRKGQIIIISEMNLLPSGFLEGRLNDVLTGNAKEGFALFATINSLDFSGREKLSSALQNRVIYHRIDDYTEEELADILRMNMENALVVYQYVDAEELAYAVKAHVWIRDNINNPAHKPTVRDLAQTWKGGIKVDTSKVPRGLKIAEYPSMEEVVGDVYGPLFLGKFLNGRSLPSQEELSAYESRPNVELSRVLEKYAEFIIPRDKGPVTIMLDNEVENAAAYYMEPTNSIALSTRSIKADSWSRDSFLHESSHGRSDRLSLFTNMFITNEDSLDPLAQDMYDLRHITDFNKAFPHAPLSTDIFYDRDFVRAIISLDVDAVLELMKPPYKLTLRRLFAQALISYAAGHLTRDHIAAFAEVVEGLFEANPFTLALNHLEQAREIKEATTRDGDEEGRRFQQFRVLKRIHAMRESYDSLPPDLADETPREESPSVETAQDNLESAVVRGPQREQRSLEGDRPENTVADGEAIVRKRAELEEKRRAMLAATKEDIIREFELMDTDLNKAALPARVVEMLDQLTNEQSPFSLLRKIRQVNDEDINDAAEEKKEELTAILKFAYALTQILRESDLAESRVYVVYADQTVRFHHYSTGYIVSAVQIDDLVAGNVSIESIAVNADIITEEIRSAETQRTAGVGVGTLPGMGGQAERFNPVGARYATHTATKTGKEGRPVPMGDPRVERQKVNLTVRETGLRDERMKYLTGQARQELNDAIEIFFKTFLNPDRVYGPKGATIDVRRFITQPTEAFVSTSGKPERTKKNIVLTGTLPQNRWNIILEELFYYLFSQGFTVTLYSETRGDLSYIDGIRTVSDLKKHYTRAEIDTEKIGKDLQERNLANSSTVIDIADLQRKVQVAYAHAAVNGILRDDPNLIRSDIRQEKTGHKGINREALIPFDNTSGRSIVPIQDSSGNIVVINSNNEIEIRDPSDGQILFVVNQTNEDGKNFPHEIMDIVDLGDDRYLTATKDFGFQYWNTATGRNSSTSSGILPKGVGFIAFIEYTEDDYVIALADDNRMYRYDFLTHTLINSLQFITDDLTDIELVGSDMFAVAQTGDGIRLYSKETLQEVNFIPLDREKITKVINISDSFFGAVNEGGMLRIWKIGEKPGEISIHKSAMIDAVNAVRYDADHLAVRMKDGRLAIYNYKDGVFVTEVETDGAHINEMNVLLNGNILTVDRESNMAIWSVDISSRATPVPNEAGIQTMTEPAVEAKLSEGGFSGEIFIQETGDTMVSDSKGKLYLYSGDFVAEVDDFGSGRFIRALGEVGEGKVAVLSEEVDGGDGKIIIFDPYLPARTVSIPWTGGEIKSLRAINKGMFMVVDESNSMTVMYNTGTILSRSQVYAPKNGVAIVDENTVFVAGNDHRIYKMDKDLFYSEGPLGPEHEAEIMDIEYLGNSFLAVTYVDGAVYILSTENLEVVSALPQDDRYQIAKVRSLDDGSIAVLKYEYAGDMDHNTIDIYHNMDFTKPALRIHNSAHISGFSDIIEGRIITLDENGMGKIWDLSEAFNAEGDKPVKVAWNKMRIAGELGFVAEGLADIDEFRLAYISGDSVAIYDKERRTVINKIQHTSSLTHIKSQNGAIVVKAAGPAEGIYVFDPDKVGEGYNSLESVARKLESEPEIRSVGILNKGYVVTTNANSMAVMHSLTDGGSIELLTQNKIAVAGPENTLFAVRKIGSQNEIDVYMVEKDLLGTGQDPLRQIRTLRGGKGVIDDILHIGGGLLALKLFDGTIEVFDASADRMISTLKNTQPSVSKIIRISEDVIALRSDRHIQIYDLRSGNMLNGISWDKTNSLPQVLPIREDRFLFTDAMSREVKFIRAPVVEDTASPVQQEMVVEPVLIPVDHLSNVSVFNAQAVDVVHLNDVNRTVSVFVDGSFSVRDAKGRMVNSFVQRIGGKVMAVAAWKDHYFLAGTDTGEAHLVDVNTGRIVHTWLAHDDGEVLMGIHRNNLDEIITTGSKGKIKTWKFAPLENNSPEESMISVLLSEHYDTTAGSELGSNIAGEVVGNAFISSDMGKVMKIWLLATHPDPIVIKDLPGNIESIKAIDGRRFITADELGNISMWSLNGNSQLMSMQAGDGSIVESIHILTDGMVAVEVGAGNIEILHIPSQQRLAVLEGHSKTVFGMATAEEGRMISVGSDGEEILWELPMQQLTATARELSRQMREGPQQSNEGAFKGAAFLSRILRSMVDSDEAYRELKEKLKGSEAEDKLQQLFDQLNISEGNKASGNPDSAMLSDNRIVEPGIEKDVAVTPSRADNYGGIDLNSEHLDLQIKRDPNGTPLPLPDQPIGNMNIEGFTPIIIEISPVTVPMILGELEAAEKKQLSML